MKITASSVEQFEELKDRVIKLGYKEDADIRVKEDDGGIEVRSNMRMGSNAKVPDIGCDRIYIDKTNKEVCLYNLDENIAIILENVSEDDNVGITFAKIVD